MNTTTVWYLVAAMSVCRCAVEARTDCESIFVVGGGYGRFSGRVNVVSSSVVDIELSAESVGADSFACAPENECGAIYVNDKKAIVSVYGEGDLTVSASATGAGVIADIVLVATRLNAIGIQSAVKYGSGEDVSDKIALDGKLLLGDGEYVCLALAFNQEWPIIGKLPLVVETKSNVNERGCAAYFYDYRYGDNVVCLWLNSRMVGEDCTVLIGVARRSDVDKVKVILRR